jgi:hypothetical protein
MQYEIVILAFLESFLLLLKLLRRWRLLVLVQRLRVYSRLQHQNRVQHIHIHANEDKI